MKKVIRILIGVLCLFMLAACSEKPEQEEEPQYSDENFVKDMAKGLQKRWQLNNEDERKEGYENISADSEEYKKMMDNYIEAELNCIEKYQQESFKDSNLQEMAITYINLLKKHKDIESYMTVDYEKYEEEFEPIYNERSKIIAKMVDEYGLTVDEEYQQTLKDFITNSQMVENEEKTNEAIEKMLSEVEFKKVSDDGTGWRTYQGIIENTTDIDFKSFQVSINLLDKDDVIIESMYDDISNFKKGSKARFEFSTDKEFDSTQTVVTYWE